MDIVEEFDILRKHITTKKGKELSKDFRKKLKRINEYSYKLDSYLSDTLDGVKPEESAKYNNLL